jgi:hypothetical protein
MVRKTDRFQIVVRGRMTQLEWGIMLFNLNLLLDKGRDRWPGVDACLEVAPKKRRIRK